MPLLRAMLQVCSLAMPPRQQCSLTMLDSDTYSCIVCGSWELAVQSWHQITRVQRQPTLQVGLAKFLVYSWQLKG